MRAKPGLRWVKLVLLLSVVALLGGCTAAQTPSSEQMRAVVQADIAQVMADIDAAIKDGSPVGLSSNPFDYVGISPAFGRLIERGEPALEAIATEIESSPENGLREYLLAMAGNGILGDQERYKYWDTGKGWAALYRSDH
jgi:hypothetical protein